MTKNDRDYLKGLVRMDIRRKERSYEQIKRKPGQTLREFREFEEKLYVGIKFRKKVLERLTEE